MGLRLFAVAKAGAVEPVTGGNCIGHVGCLLGLVRQAASHIATGRGRVQGEDGACRQALSESCSNQNGPSQSSKSRTTGAVTYEQGGYSQSEADSEGVSLVSYIHAIHGLIMQTRARRIFLVGCGGGTLGTMLVRAGCAVTIVDVNPVSFTFARQYFSLPADVQCEVADGKSFLLSDTTVYDAIVLDAYHGDWIPSHLQSLRFFQSARARLAPRGAVFANVHVQHDHDQSADRLAVCMSDVWTDVRLLDSQGVLRRNAIVMAGAVASLGLPYVHMPPIVGWNEIETELATMRTERRFAMVDPDHTDAPDEVRRGGHPRTVRATGSTGPAPTKVA